MRGRRRLPRQVTAHCGGTAAPSATSSRGRARTPLRAEPLRDKAQTAPTEWSPYLLGGKRRLVPCACVILIAASACAQTNLPIEALTLDQALALAERSHPDLAESAALVRAADGRVQQAGAWPNPEAIVRMENAPMNGRATRDADYLAGVGLTVPLGNRRGRAANVEEFDRQRLGFEADNRKIVVHRRVQGAFALALYQEQALSVRRELMTDAEHSIRLTRARVDAGDAVSSDLARVEVESAGAGAEWRRCDLLRQQALAGLASSMGLPAAAVRSVQGSLTATLELPALEQLTSDLASHPAVAAARADLAARNAAFEWSKAARIPDLKAELLYRRIESERQDAFDVGFSLPLPLFDRGRGRMQESDSQRDAAEARLRSSRSRLQADMREAHALLTAAIADVRTLEDGVLPKMEVVRQSAETRYAAGDLSLGETLSIRRDHAAVRLRHLEALRDVMLAWAQLRPFIVEPAVGFAAEASSRTVEIDPAPELKTQE